MDWAGTVGMRSDIDSRRTQYSSHYIDLRASSAVTEMAWQLENLYKRLYILYPHRNLFDFPCVGKPGRRRRKDYTIYNYVHTYSYRVYRLGLGRNVLCSVPCRASLYCPMTADTGIGRIQVVRPKVITKTICPRVFK